MSTPLDALNAASVQHLMHPLAEIDWSEPIDADSEAWIYCPPELCSLHGHPVWDTLTEAQKRRLGLLEAVNTLGVGIWFENALSRGLLRRAEDLAPGSPEHEYLLHEVGEEARHSQMFGAFIARSGVPFFRIPRMCRVLARMSTWNAVHNPVMFFASVVAGEEGPDAFNRATLADGRLHPALRRISEIHIREEARHLAFARLWLRAELPKQSRAKLLAARMALPLALKVMLRPLVRWEIYAAVGLEDPRALAREVLRSRIHRERRAFMFRKFTGFMEELGLINGFQRRRWAFLGWPLPAR